MFKVYVDEKVKCTGCNYRGLVEDDGLCGKCWMDKAQAEQPDVEPGWYAEFTELFSH